MRRVHLVLLALVATVVVARFFVGVRIEDV